MARTSIKTVATAIRAHKLNTSATIIDFLQGKRLKVVGNKSAHNYGAVGTTFVVDANTDYNNYNRTVASANTTYGSALIQGGNTLYWTDVVIEDTMTEENLTERIKTQEKIIKDAQKEIKQAKEHIALLQELGVKELDEDTLKVYRIMQTLKSNSGTEIEKAQKIAAIVSN